MILKTTTFLLADDHSVVRLGMEIKIRELVKDPVFYHSSTYRETLKTVRSNKIDVLILDINFPDGNSTNNITDILLAQPDLKILIFSACEEDIYAIRYLQSGATGYLSKLSSDVEMKDALHTFLNTGKYISPKTNQRILDNMIFKKSQNPLDQLSNREIEIALFMIKGRSNNEISKTMKLKNTTISTYKKRIFEKLEIESLSNLMEIFKIHYGEI